MAERSPSQSSIGSLNRSQSSLSFQSNAMMQSRHPSMSTLYSTTSTRRRRGFFNKLSSGFQTMFRRFSRSHKSLTEMEAQILSTITNFNREEIEQWHAKFLADCPHGYMTRRQFISMYKSLSPKSDVERFARHIFRAFDLDKSNTVDFREFLIGLSVTSAASSAQTKLEWIFHVFDIDGNGLLTRNECSEVIDTIVRFNQSQQPDEHISDTEQLVTSAKKSMMKIFDNTIERHRDALTMSQFVEGCQKDKFITKILAPHASTSEGGSTIVQNL